MSKSLGKKFQQNVIIISIILTVVFLMINIVLYFINNNYLIDKVEEENKAFLAITTHIMNENELPIAIEYVEHYTHIHEVKIEVQDQDEQVLFSSKLDHQYTSTYTINTIKGDYTIYIDNTDSITVTRVERNTAYVNASLLTIYVLSLLVLIKVNKDNANQIEKDMKSVLELMDNEHVASTRFNHVEFEYIYQMVHEYLEHIDMLREQKEMNMKGLAHDIKTPLTLVYSYFERILKNETLSSEEIQTAFESSKRINTLLNDLIDNKERSNIRKIDISKLLHDKLIEYTTILDNKHMSIQQTIEPNVVINWNEKDFARVIDNLISNAYYYSNEGSILFVQLVRNEKVYLTFKSSPKTLDTINDDIFKKGVRGNNSNVDNNYGKGYGLYICRLLLQSVGGSIEVSIQEKDVEFTIVL